MIQRRPPDAKALAKGSPVDQDRKPGDRRRSDTTVFLAVNDADFGPVGLVPRRDSRETEVFGFWGEYGRKAET